MKKIKEFFSLYLIYLFIIQPFFISISSASYINVNSRLEAPKADEPQAYIDNPIAKSELSQSLKEARSLKNLFRPEKDLKSNDEIIRFIENSGDINSIIGQKDKASESKEKHIKNTYGKLPLYFIKNMGQMNEKVRYYAKQGSTTIWLTDDEIVFDFMRVKKTENKKLRSLEDRKIEKFDDREKKKYERDVVRMKLQDANTKPLITGKAKQPGIVNYIIGNDPSKWRTNIPTYSEVYYSDVYAGIDMRFYTAKSGGMEYDFIVHPGADPEKIQVAFEGIEGMKVDGSGDLITKTLFGELRQKRPYIYQMVNGEKKEVKGGFKASSQKPGKINTPTQNPDPSASHQQAVYSFQVASYIKTYPLIIDPSIVYSTYLGGSNSEGGRRIAVDNSGNAYVTGETNSLDFPTVNALYPNLWGSQDAFIFKLNANGTAAVYSTYWGGSSDEFGFGIAVDSSGNAYVTGITYSSDFPTVNVLYPALWGSSDAFIFKLNASGTAAIYSTYLGGSGYEFGFGITVDSSGNAYVTGITSSSDFPTANALYPNLWGYTDAFIFKLNASGTAAIYSTYLGGSGSDDGYGIAVDSSGNAYVTGTTFSSDFPTVNALYPTLWGTTDAFIFKLNASGTSVIYSTYLGGSDNEYGYSHDIAVDSSGNAYVTGTTFSSDFPTVNALYPTLWGDSDAFIFKLNASGTSAIYSTYLGGSGYDYGYGIAVDSSGNAYVTGYTGSPDFPTINALYPDYYGLGWYAFIFRLNASGTSAIYSTYLGGSSEDWGHGIAVDNSGNAYVVGMTTSSDFPTVNALYPNLWGGSDAFITKISSASSPSDFVDHFEITAPDGSPIGNQTVNVTFPIRILARNVYGSIVDYNGSISLWSNSGAVNPTTVQLNNGTWTGNITLYEAGSGVYLGASGGGKSGTSNFFDVTNGTDCYGSIGGSVKQGDSPLPGATVYLNNYEQITTDGSYQFAGIPAGSYNLWASYNGGESDHIPVFVSCNSGESKELTVYSPCTQSGKTPVLLIPGILGSTWKENKIDLIPTLPPKLPDIEELEIYDNFITDYGWKKLKDELRSRGYEDGCTLFEVPYDWRLLFSDVIQKYLKPTINDAKNKSGASKVNVIAHSMGGLVTRAYIQGSYYAPDSLDIDRFAMIGTPNRGSALSYPLWEGGDPFTADLMGGSGAYTTAILYQVYGPGSVKDINDYAIGVISSLCNGNWVCYAAKLAKLYIDISTYIIAEIPSISMLLPTYDFLIPNGSLQCEKNSWLDLIQA